MEDFKPLLPLVQHQVNGMLKFTNKCEATLQTKELISQDKTGILKKEVQEFHFKDSNKSNYTTDM